MSLLDIDNLHVHFIARDSEDHIRVAKALNGVTFSLDRGEMLGLVGETGAGKSLTANAVIGLLRAPARRVEGSIRFDGQDISDLPDADMNRIRGDRIAMVVQSPKTSLDPLARIGEQVARVRRTHRGGGAAQSRERAVAMLAAVGIPDPERRARAWPHELSGGMAQRVLIAMALINDPDLIIADEPTTGLDVTVQSQILDLLREKVRERNLAAMIITHDLGIVAHFCDRMAVMFAGSIVEAGPVRTVFGRPSHPYTKALLGSSPDRIRLGDAVIRAGAPPNLYALPPGCAYADRCPLAHQACTTPPPDRLLTDGHIVRCHAVGAA